jgi:branched-chain amino acid transport system ATP-binding protein
MALLEIRDLHAGYGKMEILHGVSLKVEAGQIVSIIGPNGAGKSTVFRAVFGLLPVRRGRVLFAGDDVTNRPPEALLRLGIALVPQGRNVFPLMTVEENLLLGAYVRRPSPALRAAVADVYDAFPVLREKRRARAGELSGGQQQLLEMARVLLLRPTLLLLDEPTLGLAPLVFKEIFRVVENLPARGQSVLMVEQNAAAALRISHYAYVLDLGRNRYEGAAETIQHDERVKHLYLGGTPAP